MRSAEGSGRTVEEAIRDALRVLGVERDDVNAMVRDVLRAKRDDVELMVLDEGSRGVLGLGAREARVRLTLLSGGGEDGTAAPAGAAEPSVDMPAAVARDVVAALVGAMGFRATVNAREQDGAVWVVVAGAQMAPLIGRHGQTLEALELVAGLMVARRVGRRVAVVVDAERYRERRREALESLARRAASRVRRTGEPVALDPMSPSERRAVHTALAAEAGVTTHSEGEGAARHVVVTAEAPAGTHRAAPEHEARESARTQHDLDPDA